MKRIAVIGAGTMGHGIALVFALHGFKTHLVDVNNRIVEESIRRIRHKIGTLTSLGLADKEKSESSLKRIEGTTEIEVTERADFVVEAVPEKIGLKKQVFERIDDLCPENAILASNTSTLSISEIAGATKRPDKVIGTHWMIPPYIMPLVEVVRGEKTSDSTVDIVVKLLKRVKKEPILCKDVPGFVVNRLQFAMVVEALSLLEQGIATANDIDRVWTKHLGIRYALMGPTEFLDGAGLDVALDCISYLYEELKHSKYKPPGILVRKVQAGELGLKSGKGLRDYEKENIKKMIDTRDRRLVWLLKELRLL